MRRACQWIRGRLCCRIRLKVESCRLKVFAEGGSIDRNGKPFAQTLGPGRTAVRPPSRMENHKIAKAACCEKKRGDGSSFFAPLRLVRAPWRLVSGAEPWLVSAPRLRSAVACVRPSEAEAKLLAENPVPERSRWAVPERSRGVYFITFA